MAKWRLSGALAGALVIAVSTLWSAPSNALTLNFSFTDGIGTVTGEIDGLTAGGTGEAATHVFIDSAPFSVGFTLPHDTINDTINVNSFNVNASGQITSYSYNAFVTSAGGLSFVYDLCLGGACAYNDDTSLTVFLSTGLAPTGNHVATSTITFTSTTATPLPAALPLFATGIGGLGLLGWRRKRKARAVV
jgi:hypothetical protein